MRTPMASSSILNTQILGAGGLVTRFLPARGNVRYAQRDFSEATAGECDESEYA